MHIDNLFGALIIKAFFIMAANLIAIVVKQQVQSYLIRVISQPKPFAEFVGSLVGVGTFILILFSLIL